MVAKKIENGSDFGREAVLRRLGQLAKQRREELGLGRVAFAREAGIASDATVQAFEFAQRLPQGSNLRRIEKGLGWKSGVIEDILLDKDRRASSISFDDLDKPAVQPGRFDLSSIDTVDLLEELVKRLGVLRAGMTPATASMGVVESQRGAYDLAASDDTEGDEDDDREGMHAQEDFAPEED